MKKMLLISLIMFISNSTVMADDSSVINIMANSHKIENAFRPQTNPEELSSDSDVIEFRRSEADDSSSDMSNKTLKIRVEKNEALQTTRGAEDLGRINIYDQSSYRRYDDGYRDKTIALDDNTKVILGGHNLYSALEPSVNFIRRQSDYGEYGATLVSKGKYVNVATAFHELSTGVGNTSGAIVTSTPIKLPVGELIVGSAVYNTNSGIQEATHYGILNQFRYKKFKFDTQLSKYKPNGSMDLESNTIFLQPQIDLTDSLSISTSLQNNITNKQTRSDITLKYHPVKSKRNLELEVTLTNFAEPGKTSAQQRMYLGTKFKI